MTTHRTALIALAVAAAAASLLQSTMRCWEELSGFFSAGAFSAEAGAFSAGVAVFSAEARRGVALRHRAATIERMRFMRISWLI